MGQNISAKHVRNKNFVKGLWENNCQNSAVEPSEVCFVCFFFPTVLKSPLAFSSMEIKFAQYSRGVHFNIADESLNSQVCNHKCCYHCSGLDLLITQKWLGEECRFGTQNSVMFQICGFNI